MLENYNKNPLIQLADDLKSGEISLKDLYLDQLMVDLKNVDEDFLSDVEQDSENYTESTFTPKLPSFEFTKSVMNQINNQFVHQTSTVTQTPEQEKLFRGLFQGNFEEQAVPAFAAATQEQNNQSFNDQFLKSNGFNSADNNLNNQGGPGSNKKPSSGIFTKTNMFFAGLAFVATMFGASMFSKNNDAGFSTLANSAPVTQAVTLASNTPNPNFQPMPLSEGAKYISLSITKKVETQGLLITKKQATNLRILLSNYEIHRRLGTKKK